MSRILKHKERVERIEYRLEYYFRPDGDGGCAFDCDENGLVDESKLQPAGLANLRMCQEKYQHLAKVDKHTYSEWEPGEMQCDCGEKLEMYRPGADIDCEKCGRSYNSAGQLLAPRSQWGEETGETAADYDFGFNNPERAFEE